MPDFSKLTTESYNKNTSEIDKMTTIDIVRTINGEDKKVAFAVEKALNDIAACVDVIASALGSGGNIYYCGAGTSGRLGVLDASECVPTYGVSDKRVVGLMAGGYEALYSSVESAEDDPESIVSQLVERGFCEKDVLIAISASGSANCVKGALKYATERGGETICVTCNPNSDLIPLAKFHIVAEVGAEVITGSTRMKAGTAQKMILNMLSTGAMIKYGRVRGNYMAYMIPSNKKLVDRAIRMICSKTGCPRERAVYELKSHGNRIYEAIDAIENNQYEQ